jgi:hypothetical protein
VKEDQPANLLSGEGPPPCARCGGPRGRIRFVEVVVPAAAA